MLRRGLLRLMLTPPLPALETPNPDCMQFRATMGDEFMPGDYTCDVPTRQRAHVHPLAEMIFDQYEREVRSVFLARNYVSITKWADVQWYGGLDRSVGGLLAEYLLFNEPMEPNFDNGYRHLDEDVAIKPDDSDAVQCIKELIKSEIKPMVQRDGGDVRFLGFNADSGVVSLEMMGACKTCPSSRNTLKDGIERMMRHFVEEVKEVIEVKRFETEEKALERDRRTAEALKELEASTGVVGGNTAGGNGQNIPSPENARTIEEREYAVRYQMMNEGIERDDARLDKINRQKKLTRKLGRQLMSMDELAEPDA
jgi:Fe-S cluster biogenesis protein NfuA